MLRMNHEPAEAKHTCPCFLHRTVWRPQATLLIYTTERGKCKSHWQNQGQVRAQIILIKYHHSVPGCIKYVICEDRKTQKGRALCQVQLKIMPKSNFGEERVYCREVTEAGYCVGWHTTSIVKSREK